MGYRGQSYRDASAQRGPTRDPELDFLVRMIFHMALFNEPEEPKKTVRDDLDELLKKLAREEKRQEEEAQRAQHMLLKRIERQEREAKVDLMGPHPRTPRYNEGWLPDEQGLMVHPVREEAELRYG